MYTTDILETDILEAIELCADEIGHTPTVSEYEEWRANTSDDYPHNTTARNYFNGWREAVSEAGLDYPHGYTKEELIEAIKLCADEIGHPPTTTEYEEWRANTSEDYPSANTISRRISRSSKEALSEVGFDHPRGYTEEELIEAIKSCADEIGHPPTTTEYEEWRANTSEDYPGASAIYVNIKGSWKGAVSKAGFDKY